MISEAKKAGIKCDECGYELLVISDKVFCQICTNSDNTFKQKKPTGMI